MNFLLKKDVVLTIYDTNIVLELHVYYLLYIRDWSIVILFAAETFKHIKNSVPTYNLLNAINN